MKKGEAIGRTRGIKKAGTRGKAGKPKVAPQEPTVRKRKVVEPPAEAVATEGEASVASKPAYSLLDGGVVISADLIKFRQMKRPREGYFDILIGGEVVTDESIRGCRFPDRIEDPDLKVGHLVRGTGKKREAALFANGRTGLWFPVEKGFLEVIGEEIGPGAVPFMVAGVRHVLDLSVTASS